MGSAFSRDRRDPVCGTLRVSAREVHEAAGIRIEVKNAEGTPAWDGDYCHEHAERLVEKARTAGIRVIDSEAALIPFKRSPTIHSLERRPSGS